MAHDNSGRRNREAFELDNGFRCSGSLRNRRGGFVPRRFCNPCSRGPTFRRERLRPRRRKLYRNGTRRSRENSLGSLGLLPSTYRRSPACIEPPHLPLVMSLGNRRAGSETKDTYKARGPTRFRARTLRRKSCRRSCLRPPRRRLSLMC